MELGASAMVKAPRFHIRHLMIAVAAAAIFFGACVFDDRCNSCTPLSLVLFWSYVCGALSIWGARVRGWPVRTAMWAGLLLGPLGVIWAWSNRPQTFTPDPHRDLSTTQQPK